jgi:hypothetical protein
MFYFNIANNLQFVLVDCVHRSPEKHWLKGEALLRQGFGGRRWSCRESNPGPNNQPIRFLHA